MKVFYLYVATIKSENNEERGAFTSLYEAEQFVKNRQWCEWAKNAEVKIEKMAF